MRGGGWGAFKNERENVHYPVGSGLANSDGHDVQVFLFDKKKYTCGRI